MLLPPRDDDTQDCVPRFNLLLFNTLLFDAVLSLEKCKGWSLVRKFPHELCLDELGRLGIIGNGGLL